ncbi:MAG: cob(I)yrinic acid a,c-diamide adenosyltransferase [Bacteroidia bacterium]|nr:cob(I)yrinic acid a,c-diamide adenosyltransferase [Bacteroidia bacterium]
MKIYTKKGDKGSTSLLGGSRVPKYHLRIEAYGTVDELNSHLGLLGDKTGSQDQLDKIRKIQNELFDIGSHLANDPNKSHFKLPPFNPEVIQRLESDIDAMNEILPELKNFILPGGLEANSIAHICRTICRRAERRVVELNEQEELDPNIMTYLNRLSDWLFIFARFVSHQADVEEIPWNAA